MASVFPEHKCSADVGVEGAQDPLLWNLDAHVQFVDDIYRKAGVLSPQYKNAPLGEFHLAKSNRIGERRYGSETTWNRSNA